MATTASLLVIRASAIETTLEFYRSLGLSFVREQHGAGPIHYSCDLGGFVFEIYPARDGEANDSAMLGFKVESLDETLAALHELGVEPKSPPKTASWAASSTSEILMVALCNLPSRYRNESPPSSTKPE